MLLRDIDAFVPLYTSLLRKLYCVMSTMLLHKLLLLLNFDLFLFNERYHISRGQDVVVGYGLNLIMHFLRNASLG